ncbi:MAG: M48 family metalloprotease [Pseudomonadota bacterium]
MTQLRKFLALTSVAILFFAGPAAQAQGLQLIRDAEMEIFLNDYSRPIFEVAGLSPDAIEILIVGDNSFNAFAGGRYMGMNTGTLIIADTPNQIEAVIAHEAAHLAGGHTARTQDAIAAATRPMLLSLVLAAGAIAAGAPEAGIGLLGLGQTVGTANFLKYSRGQEATADQSSITYLDRLGKSSKGALEVWTKLRNSQIIRGGTINPYRQTHPLANTRLTALKTRAEASPFFDVKDSEAEIERLRYIQAKIHGFLTEPNDALRRYPLTDQSGPAHYARAVAYYRVAKMDEAISEIDTLIDEAPENPFFHELKGQMLFEFGRTEEAIAPHRQSVRLLPDNALLRINLGRALLATSDPLEIEQSVQEFKNALLLEGDNSFGWHELARAYGALDQEHMALLATAESRYHVGANADANQFARRAMAGLQRGTPEWRQASDIILATQPQGASTPLPTGVEAPAPRAPAPEKKETPDVPDPTLPHGHKSGL